MKKLFLTRKLPDEVMKFLNANFILDFNPHDRVLSKTEIIESVKRNDIILSLLTDIIDEEILLANPKLLGVCNYAVGYNNIDKEAATKLKIPITNTPDVLTQTTAELTFSLLISLAKRIVEADKFLRASKFNGWAPELLLGRDLQNKTIGIVGGGRIGLAFADLCNAFKMKIQIYDHNPKSLRYNFVDFQSLVTTSDFVSIHVPLTASTKYLFNSETFKLMKSSAMLINTSRGKIVNESDLVKALKSKDIAGAALDVFEDEPKINSELFALDNTILVPHIGSATLETRTKMGLMAARNALAISHNRIPENIVNPSIYK